MVQAAAMIVYMHFDEVVERWANVMEQSFGEPHKLHRPTMANALARFVTHLRDPDDIRTYIHLRNHCEAGMLARAKPSQFNVFHIALKQVILELVRQRYRGRRMEIVRDAVVAAIDERRLMVAQFYIESRETALRASEEKYRNAIDHAPDRSIPPAEFDDSDAELSDVLYGLVSLGGGVHPVDLLGLGKPGRPDATAAPSA